MRGLSVWILLAVTLPAAAAERWHTVTSGESVSGIAKHYYGDFTQTDLLLRFNGRENINLRPDERLRIPYCADHRIAPGDNGSTLAKRYLGRGSAWEFIAQLNEMNPGAPLQPGRTISMPLILRHPVTRGDSLSSIAASYYDNPHQSALLQRYNQIADPRDLAVGSVLDVPIVGVRLAERRADPAPEVVANPPVPDPEPAPQRIEPAVPLWFADAFDGAESAYLRGDYKIARGRTQELVARIDEIAAAEERSRVWRLAAFVEVAFDRGEQACESFTSMRSTGVPMDLDPERVSPKILKTLAECNSPGG